MAHNFDIVTIYHLAPTEQLPIECARHSFLYSSLLLLLCGEETLAASLSRTAVRSVHGNDINVGVTARWPLFLGVAETMMCV